VIVFKKLTVDFEAFTMAYGALNEEDPASAVTFR